MSVRRLVAGVDSSTQSCKVELFDLDSGARVGGGSAPHPVATPPRSEQDPRAWWQAFVAAFRAALADVSTDARAGASRFELVAISVAAQCHGLVLLDAAGEPIRPAKLWNDTESAPELAELRRRIGDRELVRRVGTLPTAAFTIGKLAWVQRHEPRSIDAARHIMLPHDYLTFRLTGRRVTDRSEASGTGYYDAALRTYLPGFLAEVDPGRDWLPLLPEVLGPDVAAGTLLPDVAEELGLSGLGGAGGAGASAAPVLVGAGGGDQHAAALGLGLRAGEVTYSFGTSGVVSTVSPTPVYDEAGFVDGVADMTDGYLPLVSTLNAAKVTDAFARILGVGLPELAELALAARGDGPTLAAYLDGERTPDLPHATGILAGIASDTSREQVARAAFEGVVLGLVAGQRRLAEVGVRVDGAVLATGGGARSAAYPQLLADVLGRPVHLAEAGEATARGAAVQAAAVATGRRVAEIRDAWAPARRVVAEPRPLERDPWPAYDTVTAVRALDRA